MKYDFDRIIDRTHTGSYKWDQSEKLFGNPDIIPMWVADMDFQAPQPVVEALRKRAEHGIYGYTFRPQSYIEAVAEWQKKRHGWEVDLDWISTSPGVVTALSLAVDTMTKPGDKIILQAPVYYPFYDVIARNGREIVNNPLRLENGRYTMDLELLEQQIDGSVTMLLLCNPHNPGGRVWTREELERLGEICLKHNILVVSDEIHGDLVFKGYKHTPFASISEEFAQNSITCIAPTKTFNIPGIQTSQVIIPNEKFRKAYNDRLKTLSLHMENCFGGLATESCYNFGEEWLEQLLEYLQGNLTFLTKYLSEKLPEIGVIIPEGTYLVWLDCSAISRDADTLKELMFKEAGVAFSEGSVFGKEGEGFLRVNIACPRSVMAEGLERFAKAARNRLS